jgi:hypothetical protein
MRVGQTVSQVDLLLQIINPIYHGVHGVSRRLHGVSYFNHKGTRRDLHRAQSMLRLRSATVLRLRSATVLRLRSATVLQLRSATVLRLRSATVLRLRSATVLQTEPLSKRGFNSPVALARGFGDSLMNRAGPVLCFMEKANTGAKRSLGYSHF